MRGRLTTADWKLIAEALDYLEEGWEHTREGGHPEQSRINKLMEIVLKRAYPNKE